MSDLARNIKKCRERLRLTIRELANMIGISNSLITHYEKGTKKPSVETLAALSDALGVSADYLLGINAKNA